jgi:prepilin-type N-terminal cleavage/methylation domain-containing protein
MIRTRCRSTASCLRRPECAANLDLRRDAMHAAACPRGRRSERAAAQAIRASARGAFTLIEVLVVVSIIAILAAVVVPRLSSAATPAPRPVADVLEADLRRARIEAMSSLTPTQLVVSADRARWWLQPTGGLGDDQAIASSLRAFGFGTLGPYGGYTLEIRIGGDLAPEGDVAIATFDDLGTRDNQTVEVSLVAPQGEGLEISTLGEGETTTWTLDAQRTRLR